jgi:hypothetical protein
MARPAHLDPARLTLLLQSGGVQSAQALAERVGADRVTVQRALRTLGLSVVQLGKTRATRYALRRSVFGQMNPHRISRLSQTGVAHEWVQLTALHGGWRLEWSSPAVRPDWAGFIHDHAGFCEGLPFFLTDLRPQGFLGRAAARRLPVTLGLPADPRNWSDDQTLFYLREQGDDLPGNLTLGDGPTERALNTGAPDPVTPETRAARYPALAAQASAGEPAGSSVEGEQPKFTTWLRASAESQVFGVLVKFTDQLDTPTGRRWADLLAAEALALEALMQAAPADASAAPPPQTFDFDGRRFYELPRFDRVGVHGRRGVVSLRALHDAGFSGAETNDWAEAAAGLHARGWIGEADLRAVQLRRLFGRLIGNTDMHFGNLAFFLEAELPLRLAPTYDMLPMLWAPRPGEASPAPVFTPPAPLPQELTLWPEAATLAERFWERVEADPRISAGFRPHAAAALAALRTLRERFG